MAMRLTLFSLLFLPTLLAEEAVWFRHDFGVVDGKPLPDSFDEGGLVWRTPVDSGISSPCVCGNRIFLTTFQKEKEELATICLDRRTGHIVWKRIVDTNRIEPVHPVGSPAASTPACNGTHVYSFFGSYGLLCHTVDGELIWKKPLGPFQDEFGASSSPILVDDMVILNEDHDVDCFLVAFDRETGDVRWRVPRDGFTRSYSTPILVEQNNQRSLVVAGSLQLTGYDVRTGDTQWWVRGLSRIVDPTPVVANGRIFIATQTAGGDATNRISMESFEDALKKHDKNNDEHLGKNELPQGAVLTRFFRIDLDQDQKLSRSEWNYHASVFERAQNQALSIKAGGTGDITESGITWKYRKGLPTVPSSVVYQDVMYMIKDSGIITSLDANTGELLQQGRSRGPGNYYASLMAGDGKVYLASERGVITILNSGRTWSILDSHDFKERILATPAIRDGRIYVRTDNALYCFEAK